MKKEVSNRTSKHVYFFGGEKADGDTKMKNLLGGKGANLAEMVNIGIPVPPGFTITTEVCTLYNAEGEQKVIELIKKEVEENLHKIEKEAGAYFGDNRIPTFNSTFRARASMPGMMDTVLILD